MFCGPYCASASPGAARAAAPAAVTAAERCRKERRVSPPASPTAGPAGPVGTDASPDEFWRMDVLSWCKVVGGGRDILCPGVRSHKTHLYFMVKLLLDT